jgi:hypothetical protein
VVLDELFLLFAGGDSPRRLAGWWDFGGNVVWGSRRLMFVKEEGTAMHLCDVASAVPGSQQRVAIGRGVGVAVVTFGVLALLVGGCGSPPVSDEATSSVAGTVGTATTEDAGGSAPPVVRIPDDPDGEVALEPGWTRLDDPPISGRTGASVARVDDRLFVFGGWDFTCPPGADCALPDSPPFADGAALDLVTGMWEQMADAPIGLRDAQIAVVGTDVYALGQCAVGPACLDGWAMLRYRSSDNDWDAFPSPAERGFFHLVSVDGGIVAFADSDEGGEIQDFRFDVGNDAWSPLPDDPLPLVYDRQVVDYNGTLLLFGSPVDGAAATKLAARLDLDTGEWTLLRESGAQGYQVWRSGDRLYLNPHFGRKAQGGVFDPVTNEWSPLPASPDADTWRNDMAGVVGSGQASFEYSAGWILDTDRNEWIEIPTRPGADTIYDETVAAAGSSLAVFGGQSWDERGGKLLSELWIWNPPHAAD